MGGAMNGLLEIKYPVNNDRKSGRGNCTCERDCLSIKDANGTIVLNVNRWNFDGESAAERRERALSFTCALVDLLNERIGKEGAMMI